MIHKIFRKICSLFESLLPLETQARRAGCNIGRNNFIASKFWGSEAYLISIGSSCAITNGVKLFTHGGGRIARGEYPKFDCFGKVEIGNFVYIGTNALIMPGVSIGDNVLVAAGSVVTKSIPSNVVVAGNPARYICTTKEYIQRNLPYNLDSKGMSYDDKKRLLLSIDASKLIKKGFIKTE